MNFSFILISDYLNESVYILANKSYKCLKKMFYALNNYKLYMKKNIQIHILVFIRLD